MSLSSCPNCGRRAKKSASSNFFPVYRCGKCNTKYCEECAGKACPKCGSTSRYDGGKVYSS